MAENQLQQGLNVLYDMEINNYLMTNAIARLDDEIPKYGRSRSFIPPQKPAPITYMPIVKKGFKGWLEVVASVLEMSWIGFILGVLLAALTVGTLGLPIWLTSIPIWKSRLKKREKDMVAYEKAMENYNKAVAADKQRVKMELAKKNALIEQKAMLKQKLAESSDLLSTFYDQVGIDKKYRNLIPIGYMVEFARLGIATKLGGADGLYYLIMKELRWEQLNFTMQEICARLDTIIDNQRSIYSELCGINEKCEGIVRNTTRTINLIKDANLLTEEVAQQTAAAAYHSERTQQELAYQNFMLTYAAVTV